MNEARDALVLASRVRRAVPARPSVSWHASGTWTPYRLAGCLVMLSCGLSAQALSCSSDHADDALGDGGRLSQDGGRDGASGDGSGVDGVGPSDGGTDVTAPPNQYALVFTPPQATAFQGESVSVSVGYVAGPGYTGEPALTTPTGPAGMTIQGYLGSAASMTAGSFIVGVAPNVAPGTYRIQITVSDARGLTVNATYPVEVLPGKLDPTFGSGGTLTTTYGTRMGAAGVALQGDGKLVVCGGARTVAGADVLLLVRYTPTGSVDTTFGASGMASIDLSSSDAGVPLAGCSAIAVQSDGKIVVTGLATASGTGAPKAAIVARFDTAGALDPSFGDRAGLTLLGGTNPQGLLVEPGGTIVVSGNSSGVPAQTRAYRMNTSGAVITTADSQASNRALGRQSTGRWIVSGYHVRRIDTDGGVDTSFAGAAETDNERYGLAIQSDDKVVSGGSTGGGGVVRRLLAQGGPDNSFGAGGATCAARTGRAWSRRRRPGSERGAGP